MLFKFFSRPAPVVLRNYPNFHLAKLFAQSVRDNDLSAVSRICEKYPSIINHCSRERDELFPLSVALVNHSRGISSDPIIEFLLGKSASTRLQRTREVAWIGGGGGSPASFGIDRVQEKIENYNGPLKKELEERFKLESSVLAISEAVRSASFSFGKKLPVLLRAFNNEFGLIADLMDIPVCDGEVSFETEKSSAFRPYAYDKVTGIPSSPSLQAFLIEECNALPDDQHAELIKQLDGKLDLDFGHISGIRPGSRV